MRLLGSISRWNGSGDALLLVKLGATQMECIGPEPDSSAELHHAATVLVVEDEELVCEITCEVLGHAGYEVLHAGSAAEARTLFAKRGAQIDILLCDAVLPDQNGIDLADMLAREFPALQIVISSGYPRAALNQSSQEGNEVAFLTKPYSGHAMLAKIRTMVESRAAARQSSVSA